MKAYAPIVGAIGAELRAAREGFPMSRAELAERTGVSERSLIAYENGDRELQFGQFVRLCQALDVDPVVVFELAAKRAATPVGRCPTCHQPRPTKTWD